jgi:3-deoxy-D-manno-octulosonic-acid transferase
VLFPVLALMKKTRDGLLQRFGVYPPALLPPPGRPRIWLHGASAGDLLALAPMIDRLRARFPEAKVVVSTMTNTGHLMARERLKKSVDAVVYAPWDLFGATRRAVRAIAPDLLVLEYTEIWPNLIRAASRSGAKVALTNGRFSSRHLGRYRALFSAIGNPLHDVDLLLMREDEEAERALQLGAVKERVLVTGNTKFDALVPLAQAADDGALRAALGLPDTARVWICGSTHEGEEELLFGAYKRLIARRRPPRRAPQPGQPGAGAGGGARLHRRAGPRLPPRDPRLRRRQLHQPRRAEHPRAGGAREAGPLRAAHGELPRLGPGAGGPRRHPGERRRAPGPRHG